MGKGFGWLIFTIIVVVICSVMILGVNREHDPRPVLQPDDSNEIESNSTVRADARELPILEPVPAFQLTTAAGEPIHSEQLLGRAWLIHFISAEQLAAESPVLELFRELQESIRENQLNHDVQLFSVVLNAGEQPSEQLAEAAQRARADQTIWHFATGPSNVLQPLEQAFLAPQEDQNEATGNERFFALVDPQGDIRAKFDAHEEKGPARILAQLQTALGERVMLLNKRLQQQLPNNLISPTWLTRRKELQLATRDQLQVFHGFSFTDRMQESGIRFKHRIVDDAGRSFVTAHYDHGNGLAVADVDGDGRLDVYFVNQVGGNQLWKNHGDGTFSDITDQAGVAVPDRIGVSASFADIDNDGDADLYVTTVRGGNALFENEGQGRFRDISQAAGVNYVGHSSAAVFFDYDRDGLLDLLLVNVGQYTTDKLAKVVNDRVTGEDSREYSYYTSNPDAFAAHLKPDRSEASVLYHNDGENRFSDVSQATGLVDLNWTGDATVFDANGDGWLDLYFVNMQGHDEFYFNVEGQRFERKGRELFPATPWGSMGAKAFDFENDGDLDLYVTDMHTDMAKDLSPLNEDRKIPKEAMDPDMMATDGNHVWGNAFYVQEEDGRFVEASDRLNVENYWPWGFSADDLNADGYLDLFVTASMSFPFRYAPNRLLLNNRGEQYLSSEFILGVEPRRYGRTAIPWFELDLVGDDRSHPIARLLRDNDVSVRRAVAWGALGSRSSVIFDIENDGDLDIVTNDFNAPPMVLISNLSEKNPNLHYLKVVLVGQQSNRDGLGAVVRVRAGDSTLMRLNDGSSGYLSHSRQPLYFGLGEHASIDEIEVTWPSGRSQVLDEVEINSTITIQESP